MRYAQRRSPETMCSARSIPISGPSTVWKSWSSVAQETLTGRGRGTDRAVVLNEEETRVPVALDLGHVPSSVRTRASCRSFSSRETRTRCVPVFGPLPGAARCEHTRQAFGPKRVFQRVDEGDAQFRIGLGEQPVSRASQSPVLCGPADRDGPALPPSPASLPQRIKMLPHRHRRQAQSLRKLRGVHGTPRSSRG